MATGTEDPEKTQPWAPEGASRIGAPPVSGTGGERGTAAFGGNDELDANGYPLDPTAPVRGPAIGTAYHSGGVHSSAVADRERTAAESTGTGKTVPELTVTADDATPAAGADVVLTAHFTTSEGTLPSGTVDFKEGATVLVTSAAAGGTPRTAVGTVTGGFLAGAHRVYAVYAGDAHYEAVTSDALTVTAT